jgi:hypothetical protein
VLIGSHIVIDRTKAARYVAWMTNWFGPFWQRPYRPKPWAACRATGYDPDLPVWLSTWLLIAVDNTLHVTVNALCIVGAVTGWL